MSQARRLMTPWVKVKIGDETYFTGDSFLIDAMVRLSENEGQSICQFSLRDTTGAIADKWLSASYSQGGLLDPTVKAQVGTSTTVGSVAGGGHAIGSQVAAASEFTPEMNAFLDTVAFAEGTSGPEGYRTLFGYKKFDSYAAHPDLVQRSGGYASAAAGRYQFMPDTWNGHRVALGLKDFGPQNQDRAAVREITQAGAADEIQSGNISGAFRILAPIWVSLPGDSGVDQPQRSEAELLKVYQERLSFYKQGGKSANIARQSAESVTQTSGGTVIENGVKGSNIEISMSLENNQHIVYGEFIHVGTTFSGLDNNVIQFDGVGVRWLLNRRIQNARWENATLKSIARQITSAHGLGLVMEDEGPTFDAVSQAGITDLRLLNNLCDEAGYRIYEASKSIYIEPRSADQGFVIEFSVDGDKVTIVDRAQSEADASNPTDPGKDTSTGRITYTIEGSTGKKEQLQPENKANAKSSAQAGAAVPPLKPKTTPQVTQDMRGRRDASRRVKGMVHTIELTTTQAMLAVLTPDTPVILQGLIPFSNRAHVVESVTHTYSGGALRTSLVLYTPMRAKIQQRDSTSTQPVTGPIPPSVGPWSLPMAVQGNSISSRGGLYGQPRSYGGHVGLDYGGFGAGGPSNPTDTVFAMKDAQVIQIEPTYGKIVFRTDDGWKYVYLHMRDWTVNVGDQVKLGQVVGNRGNRMTKDTHLHFELFTPTNQRLDPLTGIPGISQSQHPPIV